MGLETSEGGLSETEVVSNMREFQFKDWDSWSP